VRVLVVNKFLHHVGGVETYVDWQARNLARIGVDSHFFGMVPPADRELIDAIRGRATLTPYRAFNGAKLPALRAAVSSIYSPAVEQLMIDTIDRFQPDLVHFHSTCRQLTAGVARALSRRGLPGILTAHEYKQVCATQRLWDERQNRLCTACLSGSAASRMKNVAVRKCVRGSTVASLFAVPEIPIADRLWAKSGVTIHAPSRFMGEVLATAPYVTNEVCTLDLPWGKAELRSPGEGWEHRAIYVGRLEREKGVDVLLDAWSIVEREHPAAELLVAGDGADRPSLERRAADLRLRRVRFAGRYERADLGSLLNRVAVSIHPSLWFENSPYTVRESLLHGVPAIVSNVGGMPELVDAHCGTVVPPGDAGALSQGILAELSRRSAGSTSLREAVTRRAMSEESHLEGLKELYGAVMS
jgi:glycosyltransferase involved in cell wall biosynthesis